MPTERDFPIICDGLILEGRLHEGAGRLAALVLHPHPQYGGDMDNHVVIAIRDTFAEAGGATLRLNFRGVGRSQDTYSGGAGERADAIAALAALREAAPGSAVVVAGYSFGAAIAAATAPGETLAALVLVSPPLAMEAFRMPPGLRALVATGEHDAISPADGVRALAGDGVEACVVPGADHGWWPGVDDLQDAVAKFIARL